MYLAQNINSAEAEKLHYIKVFWDGWWAIYEHTQSDNKLIEQQITPTPFHLRCLVSWGSKLLTKAMYCRL